MWSTAYYVTDSGAIQSLTGNTWMHEEMQSLVDVRGPFLTREDAERARETAQIRGEQETPNVNT